MQNTFRTLTHHDSLRRAAQADIPLVQNKLAEYHDLTDECESLRDLLRTLIFEKQEKKCENYGLLQLRNDKLETSLEEIQAEEEDIQEQLEEP
jgi:septation ring formation regulator EzrA